MTYRQKTAKSMRFYLRRKCQGKSKSQSLRELNRIWPEVRLSDKMKAYMAVNEIEYEQE